MRVDNLPLLDAVILSHDHYDHLDYETITELKDRVKHFYAPLGVGAHLEEWGVPGSAITEMDWWESTSHNGLELTLTPARHFSGRGFSRFETLWGSWVIAGRDQKVFFNGDSGYFPGFKEIGEKYGPFDITLMECGAYNEKWAEIHMMPEETVQAHLDLNGEILLPIHWGKFNLSLHPWKEPVERMTQKAKELGVRVCTPEVGDVICIGSRVPSSRWWENYQ